MYIEIDANNKVLGHSDKPSNKSIETNEQLPSYTDTQVLKFVNDKFVVEDSQELADEKAEYDSKKYQRDRKQEYPTIEELVVALYDEEDKQAIIEKRNAVKAKYPKPE